MQETKIMLSEKEIPKQWYNIMADMPNLDLAAYDDYLTGRLVDYEYPDKLIKESLAKLPVV